MQSLHTDAPWHRRVLEPILRAVRALAARGTPAPSRFRGWTGLRSIDFDGEDESLTQAQLGLLK